MRKDPVPPDSPATKAALLPARIAWWRKCGADELAAKLEAELAAQNLSWPPIRDPKACKKEMGK